MKAKTGISMLLFFTLSAGFISDLYLFRYPDYFPEPVYDLENNPLATDKISLGRALFYDPILSRDSTISCASCHSPYNAFAHTDHDLSHGIDDAIGTRNALPLFNLAWQKSFMWDGAINHLDMQSLAPISHPDEMGESIENVVAKLQKNRLYPSLFEKAFGKSQINGAKILKALAQFQLTLVSSQSKYDDVKSGVSEFTSQEAKGYELFQQNCNSCHTEPLFTNVGFASNDLPVDSTLNDFGKWMITKQSKDSLLFKVPTLRNLSFTYPYMHDGRFRKLSQVLKHYDGKYLSAKEKQVSINLSSNDRVDLIAFLRTLNDRKFIFNPKHQYPKEILHSTE